MRISLFAVLFGLAACAGFAQAPTGTTPVPAEVVEAEIAVQTDAAKALGVEEPKQILFGDTHVHTTYSVDAFFWALPIMNNQGEGGYPPHDACDYARYCSALDYYVLTDHAESYVPEHWRIAKESIRQCNAVSGDPTNPDLVAFTGFEWTQVGTTPETHYGHKNVLFLGTDDDELPTRPIAASGIPTRALRQQAPQQIVDMSAEAGEFAPSFESFRIYYDAFESLEPCPPGVDTKDLPVDCFEQAATPAELYEKLDQWGFDTIVIPHGTSWGFYTPPGTTFDKHLTKAGYDADKQLVFEIYSGHGNSEVYKDWRAIGVDESGNPFCPEPTDDYLPSCWQAGEIIRDRCLAEGVDAAECEQRAVATRDQFARQATVASHAMIPGTTVEDWLDAGQARGLFQPAFNYRPAESAQYSIAIRNFDDPENPLRHKWGFIGSSDNHRARPGTGYKEYDRHVGTEGTGPINEHWRETWFGEPEEPVAQARPLMQAVMGKMGFQLAENERQASFFYTGGLAAVHSEGRSREAIWDAMKRKEVYGTSGDRILLWFDLVNGPEGDAPMGSDVSMSAAPKFVVRAVGAHKQLPGCPEFSTSSLSSERLEDLCKSECYNPSDERKLITRIEIVRVRPQNSPDEDVADLIEDQWKVIECEPNPEGCRVEFSDEDFDSAGRDTVYYARAIQEPSLAVNGAGLRTTYDDEGNAIAVNPCYGDYRTDPEDDCLAEVEERAWSSPIYVDFAGE